MKVKYPIAITTAQDKTHFLYRTQELLRLEHNAKGKDYREDKITLKQWNIYLVSFNIKNDLLCNDILKQRNIFKKDSNISNSLNNSFEV